MRLPVWIIVSLVIALAVACDGEFGTQLPEKPLMFDGDVIAEFDRIDEVNRITDPGLFSIEAYPKTLGIDARNSKVLLEQYFCWENCPETGAVFLIYENVEEVEDCLSFGGRILSSPWSESGDYTACQPTVE
jgi:hypothetical protein